MFKIMIGENNSALVKLVAILYGSIFIVIGFLGIILLSATSKLPIAIDPIEQLLLILIGIIFLRGYSDLHAKKISGEAFIFVGTIMGIVAGALAFLKFFFVGLVGGLINENILSDFTSRFFFYLYNPSLILGFLTFIPHKIMKQREMLIS